MSRAIFRNGERRVLIMLFDTSLGVSEKSKRFKQRIVLCYQLGRSIVVNVIAR